MVPYPDTPQPLMPFSVDLLWSVFTRLRACATSLFISSVCSAAGTVQYRLVPRPASFQSPCSLGDLKWKCDFITLLLNTFQQLFITPLTKSHFLNTIYSLPQQEPSSLSWLSRATLSLDHCIPARPSLLAFIEDTMFFLFQLLPLSSVSWVPLLTAMPVQVLPYLPRSPHSPGFSRGIASPERAFLSPGLISLC